MEFNSIYGAIKIDRDYIRSVDFMKSLGKDSSYPFINTNMFSFGDYEIPYYYHNMIIGFGATYKGFGLEVNDWNALIHKIENILRNIDFESAQFHVDSYIGDFTLFWMKLNKGVFESNEEYKSEDYKLTKTSEWYFGFGKRRLNTGFLNEPLKVYEDLRNEKIFDFKYPLELNNL